MNMISIDTMLPEFDKPVLVKLADGKFAVAALSPDRRETSFYPSDSIIGYDFELSANVVSWCELPE